jgi:hypothetical protein
MENNMKIREFKAIVEQYRKGTRMIVETNIGNKAVSKIAGTEVFFSGNTKCVSYQDCEVRPMKIIKIG